MTSTAVARHKLVSIHRKTSAHPRGLWQWPSSTTEKPSSVRCVGKSKYELSEAVNYVRYVTLEYNELVYLYRRDVCS